MNILALFSRKVKLKRAPFQMPKLELHEESDLHRLRHIFRRKVKRALGMNYEFTPEQLKLELEEKKFPKWASKRMLKTLNILEDMEYKDAKLSENNEKKLLREAEKLLALLERRIRLREAGRRKAP